MYNKTSIKRNILTIKRNTSGSRSGKGLISTPVHSIIVILTRDSCLHHTLNFNTILGSSSDLGRRYM